MAESSYEKIIQCLFAGVPEGSVPDVMPQGYGFGQVLIEPQRFSDGTGNLRNLQCMGQPRSVVIAIRREKHLGFVLEPPEGFAVDNPVPVALERCPEVMGLLTSGSPLRLCA
jgi:hypothetical protein